MNFVLYLLPLLVLLPALGGIACALAGALTAKGAALATAPASVGDVESATPVAGSGLVRGIAILTIAAQLVVAIFLAATIQWDVSGTQLRHTIASFDMPTMAATKLNFGMTFGTDGLSTLLTVTTALLGLAAILVSLTSSPTQREPRMFGGRNRDGAYYGWLLALVAAMTGVWLARDLLLFYAFFELILVPLFFLIGTFGGPERRAAATKLFIYTFAGSVLALPAILYVGIQAGDFSFDVAIPYAQQHFTNTERGWVLAGLLIPFAVKTPLFPLHTWQPSAMAEAPGNGVVDAVGLVLKLGAYALMMIAVPIGLVTPAGIAFPWVLKLLATFAVIGILYGALCAWVQTDMKRVLAYSSLSHVGFIVLGIAALSPIGLAGSAMYLVNTALITGAMFLTVGMIYSRYGTRDTGELSGLGKPLPILSFFFGLFTMAAIGLPLTSGFVSEFLTILGTFTSGYLPMGFGIVAALGIVLGAVYMLAMAGRVLFGPVKVPATAGAVKDLNFREILVLSSLAALILAMGVFPKPVLSALETSTAVVINGTWLSEPVRREASASDLGAGPALVRSSGLAVGDARAH